MFDLNNTVKELVEIMNQLNQGMNKLIDAVSDMGKVFRTLEKERKTNEGGTKK